MAFPIAAIIQQAAGMTSSLVSQWLNGKAQKSFFAAQKDAYNTNADLNDIQTANQSAYINQAAANQVHQLREQGADVQGTAKASMAAQGVDLSSASAQAVLSSSERALKEDEELIRYNAELAAFENNKQGALTSASLRSQARMAGLQGKAAKYQNRFGMLSTLLTGAAQTGGTIFNSMAEEKNRREELEAKYGYKRK